MAPKRKYQEQEAQDTVHTSRQSQVYGDGSKPTKKARNSEATRRQIHTSSVNAIKKKIRDVSRRLERSENIPADVRVQDERALTAYEQELAAAEAEKTRQKMIKKYHMVRFFERQKATRLLKKLRKQLIEANSTEEVETLKTQMHVAEVDLNYTQYFPLSEPYISLYPPKGAAAAKDEVAEIEDTNPKPKIWVEVEKCMENGTLEKLRNRAPNTPANTSRRLERRPAKEKPQADSIDTTDMNRRERRSLRNGAKEGKTKNKSMGFEKNQAFGATVGAQMDERLDQAALRMEATVDTAMEIGVMTDPGPPQPVQIKAEPVNFISMDEWMKEQDELDAAEPQGPKQENRSPPAKKQKKSITTLNLAELAFEQKVVRVLDGENWVGLLQRYCDAHPGRKLTYEEVTFGQGTIRFRCFVSIQGFPEKFGGSHFETEPQNVSFSTKKYAKRYACKQAVDWLIANKHMPGDGTVKFAKPALPPPSPQVSSQGLSFTAQVPILSHRLGLQSPQYILSPASDVLNCPLWDGFADFAGDPRFGDEGKVGHVKGVFGKKNAKEEIAKNVHAFLKGVEADRLRMYEEEDKKRKRSSSSSKNEEISGAVIKVEA
ncbi:hypothetical protein EG329_004394 [Mollisiaceae sp. DMI_Dod_QoI]|nr:hypothetical protein EG329_004394 [Helotiales sp. DMI_Dod_QoI]